jgi:four helix bundle protein
MTSREVVKQKVPTLSLVLFRAISVRRGELGDELASQLLRSVLSIGSNWCEAHGRRGTPKSMSQFFRIARGSAYEALFQLQVAGWTDLESVAEDICEELESVIDAAMVPAVEEDGSATEQPAGTSNVS